MTPRTLTGALVATLLASTAMPAAAQTFDRIASFPTPQNLPADADPLTETSAEIITATGDGMTLVYSDSPLEAIGLVDITDPAAPKALGSIATDGEPTSVAALGQTVFVAVNTSESFVEPSGYLAVLDVATQELTRSCDLGGQPDSTAVAPDGSFLAIAVENERDEDLNDGEIPQLPAGHVAIIPLVDGAPSCDGMIMADVTGLAEVAPEDPEPEFVSINEAGEIVVSLQENNHIVVLASDGSVVSHFSAGSVDLENVDTAEEGALTFDDTQEGVLREPDAVKWLGTDRIVAANEGDYEGGSRGFTIYSKTGEVLYESGLSFEYEVALLGHYPEGRSGNKGVEPEGMEVATFGDDTYIFLLAERSSIVGVYRDTGAEPELVQMLPSGIAPEGAVALPERGLLAVANEADLGEDGLPRSHVMVFELGDGAPSYPTIRSTLDDAGRPIGFGALSGLAADPAAPGRLYAVSDSVYRSQPTIFEIDATQTPAQITRAIRVTRDGMPAQKLDLEGVVAIEGGFWLASEGRTDRLIPHALYRVDERGRIREEVPFPAELNAVERRFGAEGVTMVGSTLWIAIQREWGDDEAGFVKLVSYDTETKEWGAVRYPLETPGEGAWMGLSEITAHGDFVYIVERDNQVGENVGVKALYRVPLAQMTPAPLGGELPVVEKELVRDFIPDLAQWNGFIVDKIEGFAIDAAGTGYVVTDNDGVDDSSGETFFWSIGQM
jgi:hypothetical protein